MGFGVGNRAWVDQMKRLEWNDKMKTLEWNDKMKRLEWNDKMNRLGVYWSETYSRKH